MPLNFKPTSYRLKSMSSGIEFHDSGWLLETPGEDQPALVRAVYDTIQPDFSKHENGFFRFADWLPLRRVFDGSSTPVTYKSERLAAHLGLQNLFVTFSGWWPEKGVFMPTCSFKETEAYSVCGRMTPDMQKKVLVVASAGNTARAFAKVCSANQIPLLLCVPEDNLDALWFSNALNPCVKLVCTSKESDYFDAIHLSNIICGMEGFYAEGGAKNVARRDGMGTTMLSATTFIGRIPDFYFQAVGSGTGAIAAWEANLRLIADGRYGTHKMKLMVSQNAPFQPIYEAWKAKSRAMLPYDDAEARQHVEEIDAKVLSNRKPPYPITGGLFDALTDAGGDVLLVDNEAARLAAALFETLEEVDIHPAAAVAVASLVQAVNDKRIPADATVMLNITGGGEARYKAEHQLTYLMPDAILPADASALEIMQKLEQLKW